MLGLPLTFAAPAILFGLVALPVIWWLLRLTPPRPRSEMFPPLRILAGVLKSEETPSKSPWWLTLLRLAIAGLIVLALAEPVLNPRDNAVASAGPLVLVVDNGWATADDWQARIATAERLIDDAEETGVPVSLVFTADETQNATPISTAAARERLRAAQPVPLASQRPRALFALEAALAGTAPGTLAILSDGIAGEDNDAVIDMLSDLGARQLLIFESGGENTLAFTAAENAAAGFAVSATRLRADAAAAYPITAHDVRGRPIAEGTLSFEAGAQDGTGRVEAPFELRNDFARITAPGLGTAGATFLLDDSFRRRRVALLSGETADAAQPLLSPLYYIERALQPYADLVRPQETELARAIPELLEARPSVLVMADIGTLPEDAYAPLTAWIENGGMLLRFAGPRLAGAAADDPLVPVTLRQGERALGGALSWTEPQSLAPYPASSPFAGMPAPDDITIMRQVLAEPAADLARNTWASLADGTPLVTTRATGEGRIVLFHVTAEATWSNLPISGDFVEMLRRTVLLANAGGASGSDTAASGEAGEATQTLPPYRLLNADGVLAEPTGNALPLAVSSNAQSVASFDNPPGLYGTEDGFTALNLMRQDQALTPFDISALGPPALRSDFSEDAAMSLKPILFTLAILLLFADGVIVLVMAGAFAGIAGVRRRRGVQAASAVAVCASIVFAFATFQEVRAADERPGDEEIASRLDVTHIAYVITGDDAVDTVSARGLAGLTQFLTYRTALEPGEPAGVDIETDQLAFYPLIYWPISVDAPMPSDGAISRVDAYMKSGGTVLFDTRDSFSSLGSDTSPQTERLRAILADLDIPPLEPVPEDHVLTRAFYLLPDFPGRYRDSQLWIEEIPGDTEEPSRTVSADGVSSVLITGNDLAGAWAVDANQVPMFPTVPSDPIQREYAYRAGVNIMMYMLTGNYKADQVHVPALLERLGQ